MITPHPATFRIPDDVDPRMMGRPEFADLPPVTIFPDVASHLDLAYAGPAGFRPLTLDLHVPQRGGGPFPVVVYAHGGGFVLGSKRMGPWRFLLDAGYAVASVDYRLSGEHVYPAAVHDGAAAIRWVRANASSYGVDSEKIIGFGSSAGAYLLSAVALGGDDTNLIGSVGPHAEVSCQLAAVVDHYAPTDFLTMDTDAPDDVVERMDRPGSTITRFLGYVPSDRPDAAEQASLLHRVSASAPPFLIAHGDDDHRVGIEQSRRLHRALLAAGARADFVEVPGADHGSAHFDQTPIHEATLAFLRSTVPAVPMI